MKKGDKVVFTSQASEALTAIVREVHEKRSGLSFAQAKAEGFAATIGGVEGAEDPRREVYLDLAIEKMGDRNMVPEGLPGETGAWSEPA
jgi:hypothetical protein